MSEESKPEESKTPSKSLAIHRMNLIAGILGGLACFGFVIVAKLVALELSELVSDGLILGGAMSMGVSVYSAKKLPQ